jgi:hypothetical protein
MSSGLSTNGFRTCGIGTDETVICWPDGDELPGAFRSVAISNRNVCGIRTDGSLACVGDENWAQGSPPAGSFQSIAVGDGFACAVRSNNGALVCWGRLTR